jgi:Holliday junction resolvase
VSKQKQKGTLAETALTNHFKENGIVAYRLPLSGIQDKGDILIPGGTNFTVEVKNHRTSDLATWVDEALLENVNAGTDFGVVAHKRLRKSNPGSWYVTMDVNTFIGILKRLR